MCHIAWITAFAYTEIKFNQSPCHCQLFSSSIKDKTATFLFLRFICKQNYTQNELNINHIKYSTIRFEAPRNIFKH